MNTRTRTVSVHSQALNRQANNLDIDQLANAVKPWFDEMNDANIARAISDLSNPRSRGRAADFLGLELIEAA
ncbi:MAG: hypothetical protein ACYCDN_04820 [Schaalia turicensis]